MQAAAALHVQTQNVLGFGHGKRLASQCAAINAVGSDGLHRDPGGSGRRLCLPSAFDEKGRQWRFSVELRL